MENEQALEEALLVEDGTRASSSSSAQTGRSGYSTPRGAGALGLRVRGETRRAQVRRR